MAKEPTCDANENAAQTLYPPPPHALGHKAANNGTEDRAKEWRDTVERHGETSLRRGEEVRNSTPRINERRPSERSSEESQDEKGGGVFAPRGPGDADYHSNMRGDPATLSSV